MAPGSSPPFSRRESESACRAESRWRALWGRVRDRGRNTCEVPAARTPSLPTAHVKPAASSKATGPRERDPAAKRTCSFERVPQLDDEMAAAACGCWCGVLLPRELNPSRPPVGRQNGGCWMPFEYANGGRQLCNSRPEPLGVGLGRSRRTPETCTCRSNIAKEAEVPLGLARLLCGAGVARNRASRRARAGEEGVRVARVSPWKGTC